jgi:hypothetical protein
MGRIGLQVTLRADIPVFCPVFDMHPERVRCPWPETLHQLGKESVLEDVGMLRPERMRQAQKTKQQGILAIGAAVIMDLDTGAHPARHAP